jgi:hypothetical protein
VSLIAILYFLSGAAQVISGIGVISIPIPSIPGIPELSTLTSIPIAIGLLILAVGALSLATGWGLWELRNWGRLLAIVFSALGAVTNLVSAVWLFGGFEMFGVRFSYPGAALGSLLWGALHAAVVYYLFKPEIQNAFGDGGGGTLPRLSCPSCRGQVEPGWQRCPSCGYVLIEQRTPEPKPRPTPEPVSATNTQKIGDDTTVVGQLIAKSGSRRNTVYQLQARTKVGRDARTCQIVLEDETVSSQHAEFILNSGQYEVVDLASTNHVYVNGKRVDRMMLLDGDVLKLGNTTLVYRKT